jgi:hypothetical protein
MWMLLIMLQSELSQDAKKPVETFYMTEAQCQDALKIQNDKGNYSGFCTPVTWK